MPLGTNELGRLAPIVVVMLPEAFDIVRSRSI